MYVDIVRSQLSIAFEDKLPAYFRYLIANEVLFVLVLSELKKVSVDLVLGNIDKLALALRNLLLAQLLAHLAVEVV